MVSEQQKQEAKQLLNRPDMPPPTEEEIEQTAEVIAEARDQ